MTDMLMIVADAINKTKESYIKNPDIIVICNMVA